MKTASIMILILLIGLSLNAFDNKDNKREEPRQSNQLSNERNKVLVVYFSHSGNTRVVANKIKDLTGANIFEIVPENTYPQDYNKCVKQARQEQQSNSRPQLTQAVENMASYDTLFVGYPIWCGTMPMPVFSFLESYDLSGKVIYPFCTHEGSRLGNSIEDITKLCPKSQIREGLAIRGSRVNRAQQDIIDWLDKISVSYRK